MTNDADIVAATRRYVCEDRYRLRQFDAVGQEVRRVCGLLNEGRFSVTAAWSEEEFRKRVPAFEELVANLCRVEALVARWGSDAAADTLTLPARRTCDRLDRGSGNSGWLALQWYPVLLLFYAGGVAAVSTGRYSHLSALMHASVRARGRQQPLVTAVTDGLGDVKSAFRLLAGLEKRHTPVSDRLFDVLQPLLDELLFFGSDFEGAFDTFEILYGFEYAHLADRKWGPIGRFGWRDVFSDSSPLMNLIKEAEGAGDNWRPLAAGLCGGSIERLKSIAGVFRKNVANSGMC